MQHKFLAGDQMMMMTAGWWQERQSTHTKLSQLSAKVLFQNKCRKKT